MNGELGKNERKETMFSCNHDSAFPQNYCTKIGAQSNLLKFMNSKRFDK